VDVETLLLLLLPVLLHTSSDEITTYRKASSIIILLFYDWRRDVIIGTARLQMEIWLEKWAHLFMMNGRINLESM